MGKLSFWIKGLLIALFAGVIILYFIPTTPTTHNQVEFGVSFSPRHARYLKLDWQKTYLQVLNDLGVKNLRLASYWDILQPKEDKYDFSETDFMVTEAEKAGAKIILVLGARQPRWPECHIPKWARSLTIQQRQKKTLQFIKQVIEKYKTSSAIEFYQVENEPFAYWFGEDCDILDKEFLKKEIELVKIMDGNKPIIVTDSGEWGSWVESANFADILGISIYRNSYNPTLSLYVSYPFTPWMYSTKADIVKKLTQGKKVIISELQTEPWLSDKDTKENSILKHSQLFSLESFKANIDFARKTGFDQAYLWGVEWWYFMDKNGYPQYLDFAKSLFK